jgi:transcription elongation factor Elf1
MKLTKIAKQGECPACGSCNISYKTSELDGEQLYYPAECDECGLEFMEWYALIFTGHTVGKVDIPIG